MFGKRLHIGRLAGFDIGVDLSWFFIAILLTWTLAEGYFPLFYPDLKPKLYWMMGLLGMLGLYLSVVLHEIGHAIVARHYGLPTKQITLFLLGGIAELQKEPITPKSEFLIAIAGPLVSVIIALLMFIITGIGEHAGWSVFLTGITGYLAFVNTIIVLFNMVPAFPMDGGRVLRSFLWWWKGNLGWATKIASGIGRGFGLVLIFFGILSLISGNLFVGLWWIILGLFLKQSALMSCTQYYIKESLQYAKVEKFMSKNPISIPSSITIQEFLDQYVYQTFHHLYPIVDHEKLLGYVSLKEVKMVDPEKWTSTLISSIMQPLTNITTIRPEANAADALTLMNQEEANRILVVENDKLVGILTSQDLFKLISLKLELEDTR